MDEEIPIGGIAADFTATDLDIGDNAKLVFSVTGGDGADYFYFDSIYVAKAGALKMKEVRCLLSAGEVIGKISVYPFQDLKVKIMVVLTLPSFLVLMSLGYSWRYFCQQPCILFD